MRAGLRILDADPWSGGFALLNRQRRNSAERVRRDRNYVADDWLPRPVKNWSRMCLYVGEKSATSLYRCK